MSHNHAEESTTKPKRRWVLPTVVGALSLFLGIGIGAAGDDETEPTAVDAPEPEPAVTVTVTAEPSSDQSEELDEQAGALDERAAALDEREAELDSYASELDDREASITETETEIAEGTIPGDGIFVVGEDVQAGEYRNDGSEFCYWARLAGTSGEFDDIITNGNPRGPTVLTIAESDVAFETSGCGEWVLQ